MFKILLWKTVFDTAYFNCTGHIYYLCKWHWWNFWKGSKPVICKSTDSQPLKKKTVLCFQVRVLLLPEWECLFPFQWNWNCSFYFLPHYITHCACGTRYRACYVSITAFIHSNLYNRRQIGTRSDGSFWNTSYVLLYGASGFFNLRT